MVANTIVNYITVARYMNVDSMHEEKLYHVNAQQPVQKWRSEIGYKIERIITRCIYKEFWVVALDSLAARLELKVKNYVQLRNKFTAGSTDLTEEELVLLSDTACNLNDMHYDVVQTLREYFRTDYRPYLEKLRNAFKDAF